MSSGRENFERNLGMNREVDQAISASVDRKGEGRLFTKCLRIYRRFVLLYPRIAKNKNQE